MDQGTLNYAGMRDAKGYILDMINFGPKAKVSKKAAKKTPKALPRGRARSKSSVKDLLTPEDIKEIKLFSRLIAENNARHR
jgi:hypothetical protein